MAFKSLDPWTWSVNDVVDALCKNSDLWLERPGSTPPNAAAFERALRENDVNGSTLLSEVTQDALRHDFKIQSLGQRAAVSWAIDRFKSQSDKFLAEQRRSVSRQQSIFSEIQDFYRGVKREREPDLSPSPAVQVAPPSRSPSTMNGRETPSALPVGSNARDNETMVTDASGRKRRKLDLSGTSTQPQSDGPQVDQPAVLATSNFHQVSPPKSRAYLTSTKLPVDSLFFDGNKPRREQSHERDEDDDDFDLAFVADHAVGPRQYVARQIRHFLQASTQRELVRNGKLAIAVRPYREKLLVQGRPSLLLFENANGKIQVSRTDEFANIASDSHGSDSNSEWDFLLHWQRKKHSSRDPSELPAFGDSGSEGELSSKFIEELEEEGKEAAARAQESKTLAKEDVSNAIDKTFSAFAEEWQQDQRPLREHKAWNFWRKYRTPASRRNRIAQAGHAIARCTKRLDDQKSYMLSHVDYKEIEDVRKSCANSQPTVDSREDERFYIELLQRRQPPSRPSKAPPARKQKPTQYDDDGIDVESESGSDLQDFIAPEDDAYPADIMDADQSDYTTSPHKTSSTVENEAGVVEESQQQVNPTEASEPVPSTQHKRGLDAVQKFIEAFDEADINKWDPEQLEEEQSRTKLLLKLLMSKTCDQYHTLRNFMMTAADSETTKGVYNALEALSTPEEALQITEISQDLTLLFAAWHLCRSELVKGLEEQEARCLLDLGDVRSLIALFRDHLMLIFHRFPHPLTLENSGSPLSLSDNEDDELSGTSSDEEEDSDEGRKKAPKQDLRALQRRMDARARQEQSQVFTQSLLRNLSQTSDIFGDGEGLPIQINDVDADKYPNEAVYLSSAVAKKMQQHQIEGVSFMWREVVQAGEGCLLAHTMGLGKTLQALAFILTLAETSQDMKNTEDIPVGLRQSRTLILCPATLIGNWTDEIDKWIPREATAYLGEVFVITASLSIEARLKTAKTWSQRGGLMLIGYELFLGLVSEGGKSARKLPEEQQQELKDILLNFPSLIIADEAHKMKNPNSKLSKAASSFKSEHRIALTGSPLANRLMEYFAMVDWVSPGYLGTDSEFRQIYQVPIQDGLWTDSSAATHRRSLKKLHQLQREIEPKVNRKNVEVLKGNLKTKLEFVITMSLTDLQRDLYRIIVRGVHLTDADSNATVWNWLRFLVLICNHPRALKTKLQETPTKSKPKKKEKKQTKKRVKNLEDDDEGEFDEASLDITGLTTQARGYLNALLKSVPDLESEMHATKVRLLLQIFEHADDAGDRTLVFSQSILTLNFLERLLKKRGTKYMRMDGKTPPAERLSMAKKFNDGTYRVCLLSTRASGTGYNLPGANRVVIFDFGYNPTWEEQAVGRAYRIGQEKPVFVYRFLIGGTFEEAVYNKAVFKTQLAYRAVERKNISRQATKTRDFLFEPRDVACKDVSRHVGKDKHVLDKLLLLEGRTGVNTDRPIKSIETTETLKMEVADEELTPEEEREVVANLELERLRKERPDEYRKRLASLQQAAMAPPGGPQPSSHNIANSSSSQRFSANITPPAPQYGVSKPTSVGQIASNISFPVPQPRGINLYSSGQVTSNNAAPGSQFGMLRPIFDGRVTFNSNVAGPQSGALDPRYGGRVTFDSTVPRFPADASGNGFAQRTPVVGTFPPPQVSPSIPNVPAGSSKEEKIRQVMQMTMCDQPDLINGVLTGTLWRPEQAVQKLEEMGYPRKPGNPSAGNVAGSRPGLANSSTGQERTGPGQPGSNTVAPQGKTLQERLLQEPSNVRGIRAIPPSPLSFLTQSPSPPTSPPRRARVNGSSLPPQQSGPTAPKADTAPLRPSQQNLQPSRARSPQPAVGEKIKKRSDSEDPSQDIPLIRSQSPSHRGEPNDNSSTRIVEIDLAQGSSPDAKQQRKRTRFSTIAPDSDGAFDLPPIRADRSSASRMSPGADQLDGAYDVSRKSKPKHKHKNSGFVRRASGGFSDTLYDPDAGIFDLSHLYDSDS